MEEKAQNIQHLWKWIWLQLQIA